MQPAIESTLDIDRTVFAPLLKRAIKSRGLSYHRAADLVRERLPESSRLSHVSIWHYASARATPRRIEVFQALCDAFDLDYKLGQDTLPPTTASQDATKSDDLSASGPDAELLLRDAGGGIAFVRLEAEIDWEKALQIARILGKEHLLGKKDVRDEERVREEHVRAKEDGLGKKPMHSKLAA